MNRFCGGTSRKSVTVIKKRSLKMLCNHTGFTLVEVLITIAVVGVIALNLMMFQTSSWKRTASSNKLLVAGQMIEKQVEHIRMTVDMDPYNNFPPHDSSTIENGITLCWKFSPAYRPKGPLPRGPLTNVRKCALTASWGNGKNDSLVVNTYIARFF